MPGLDGIQAPKRFPSVPGNTPPAVRTPVRPTPRVRLPAIPARIPAAIAAVGLLGAGGGWLVHAGSRLLRVEASAIPVTVPASGLAPVQPVLFATSGTPALTDDVVVVDAPSSNSLPQPDASTAITDTLPTVRVLNGGAATTEAAAARDALAALHYTVVSVGTAQFSYVRSTVYYLSGRHDSALAVAQALGLADPTLVEDPIANPAEVLVVLGADRS